MSTDLKPENHVRDTATMIERTLVGLYAGAMDAPNPPPVKRDDLAAEYLESLPFDPYPVQEEALLSWFTAEQGVLVCAPTGTGKTVIAEAAMFEALKTGQRAYYTTPLIALTDQKFDEMRERVQAWGFSPDQVGLVTGNRRVNPDAPLLVVVAEILLNRLLSHEFDFTDVQSVVMDEFHSFNDLERGIVWELSLGLLPAHVRTLLLSATVGNAYEFKAWLRNCHHRNLELVESTDRKVPLEFFWIGDQFLSEHLVEMARGPEEGRKTPALVFCFNREECWTVAEMLKGKALVDKPMQTALDFELKRYDWSEGAGPKLRQILQRGIGVHHAGVLPKYRRIVEDLFQRKMLTIAVCTETLAAGINLPARSVVIPTLMKGPPDNKKLIDPSSAHQMFGRAGRPQYDDKGYVYSLPHDDDVKLARWRERYDKIPDNAKDPGLRKAKKALKKKMPKRRTNFQYWNEAHFEKLRTAPPTKLYSKGRMPWRLLAYVLQISPDVSQLRELVGKRLMDDGRLRAGQRELNRMLLLLWRGGYCELEPTPPAEEDDETSLQESATGQASATLFGMSLDPGQEQQDHQAPDAASSAAASEEKRPGYQPEKAHPTERMTLLTQFRSVNPLYGVFLVNQLGDADDDELIQAMESVLEVPGSVARFVRVPKPEELPPGQLATDRLDPHLLRLGLVTEQELTGDFDEEDRFDDDPDARWWALTFAEKLKLLFDHDFPGVDHIFIQPVWIAGELLRFEGNFNKFILSRRLQKQEGIVFRHLLRLILLIGEFSEICPPETDREEWKSRLNGISDRIAESCRTVDPASTEKTLQEAGQKPPSAL